MAKIILTGDGQEFDIEDEVAKDDDLLRGVVKSVSPAYANPTFTRSNKDGVMTVKVSKQAGTKGAEFIDALKVAEVPRNQLEEARAQVDVIVSRKKLSIRDLLKLEPVVIKAIDDSQDEVKITSRVITALRECEGVPSRTVPVGF